MFASYVFPDKNQKPLRMSRMQITKQAVVILSLILVINNNQHNYKNSHQIYVILQNEWPFCITVYRHECFARISVCTDIYRLTDTNCVNYLSNDLKQSCFQITFKKYVLKT